MKLFVPSLFFLATAVSNVVGQLPSQLVTDIDNYRSITADLRFNFVYLPVDLDTKSQILTIVNALDHLRISINTLNTTAADLAAHSSPFAPADAVQLVDQFQQIASNTTEMVSALVTKTYFCQSYGGYIDGTMVPAKETIYWAIRSLISLSPDPIKAQLSALRTSLTDSYYKALVYRNYYHNFDRPCIPWGTWNS